MAKEYIDRNKAIHLIAWYITQKEHNYNNPTVTLDEVVGLLMDVDAANVVEAVKCNDCKHYKRSPYPDDDGKQCWYTFFQTDEDDFCSYGKRK